MDPQISGPSARIAREAVKLSQAEVAQSLGINRMYYSLFEAGRYLLDPSQLKALHDFFDSHGAELEHIAGKSTGTFSRLRRHDTPPGDRYNENSEPVGYDVQVNPTTDLLTAISESAAITGLDSKRTAAIVAAAGAVLHTLDFAELVALTTLMDARIEGLPTPEAFTSLSVADKQLWESRAAGMLICAALYKDAWFGASCLELTRAARSVRKGVNDRDWNVRDRGLFEESEKYRSVLRCQLAPHVANAAELRLAPKLTDD